MSTIGYVLKGNRDEEASIDRFLNREGIKVVIKRTSLGRLHLVEEGEETTKRR